MPMYEYLCDSCDHVFTELRPMAEHRAPRLAHSAAQSAAHRRHGAAANDMPQTQRHAHETNERSAHEPRVRHHQCGAGCTTMADRPRTKPAAAGAARRSPWMLGH